MSKECILCKECEPRVQFGKNKNSKDGKQSYCLDCYRDKRREYNKTDHAKQLAEKRKKEYKEQGKLKEYNKTYYERNRQWILARKRTDSVVSIISNPSTEKFMDGKKKPVLKPSVEKKKRGRVTLNPQPVTR
jgi:uncharacterized membrane protein